MNAHQIRLVQTSFESLAADPVGVARAFYGHLFEIAPELRPLFKTDMSEQYKKLMQMLAAAVRGLDDVNALLPALHALGRRHADYGVEPAHYELVGQALLDTLRAGLGTAFTRELEQAWRAVYGAVSSAMQSGCGAAAATA